MRRQVCSNTKHVWRRVRGGRREKCVTCGTSFPCPRVGCGHIDCHEARGEELPEGITAHEIASKVASSSMAIGVDAGVSPESELAAT